MKRLLPLSTAPVFIGLALAGFGAAMVWHWLFPLSAFEAYPQFAKLGLNTPMLSVVAGIALAACSLPETPRLRRVAAASGIVLVAYPFLVLSQSLFGIQLGLDFTRAPALPTPDNPTPSRMSPDACLAFIAAGAHVLLRGGNHPARKIFADTALGLLSVLAVLGLIGHLIGVEQLYRLTSHNVLLLPTAAALSMLALGLWLTRGSSDAPNRQPAELERRILRRAALTLTLVALAAGIGGFAVLRNAFETSLLKDARESARLNALALGNALRAGLWVPRIIVKQPALASSLARLAARPTDPEARERLSRIAHGFVAADTSGVRFLSAGGETQVQVGEFPAESSTAIDVLKVPGMQAELRWHHGAYYLHTETLVQDGAVVVGKVVMERHLPLFDDVLALLRKSDASSDALICSRKADLAVCAPSKLYATQYTIPMYDAHGKPAFPINRALLGEAGVLAVKDLRGVPVVAGFTPIEDFGLGLVIKTDVSELYAPLREHFYLMALVVAALVAAGTWALRSRVRPLLQAAMQEQQRTRTILDTSSDAFISLDEQGRVRDWNAEATRLFGWTAQEAIGQPLIELIVPPAHRDVHYAEFAKFMRTGAGPMVNRRTDMLGWHRNGYEIPVEFSISASETANGFVTNAFVRDIRERKEAQHRVETSERRLHELLSNIPAMVGHFDHNERCLFANELALRVHQLSAEAAVGRALKDGISEQAYALHEPHIKRVMQGERVRFEGHHLVNGHTSHYQVSLVPERTDDGMVCGFYLMTFDVTQMKRAKLELQKSESRLRAITDNLPVLISYVDRDHRFQFLNRTFEQWTGISVAHAVGKPLREVIGDTLFGRREEAFQQAFQGKRMSFELEASVGGEQRCLQTVYVPDMAAVDRVNGVYTLTTDITALRLAERRMAELALNDSLTGLANRRRLDERLPEALARARRSHAGIAVMFLDIDRFKQVNDTFGHAAGDAVLVCFAKRLTQAVRSTDFVVRLAGDEFVVVLEGINTAQECEAVADKILLAARQLMTVGNEQLSVTTSIGIAYLKAGSQTDAQTLLRLADEALYRTKERGRDGHSSALAGVAHDVP